MLSFSLLYKNQSKEILKNLENTNELKSENKLNSLDAWEKFLIYYQKNTNNSINYEKICFILKNLISQIDEAEKIYKDLLSSIEEYSVYEKLSNEKK